MDEAPGQEPGHQVGHEPDDRFSWAALLDAIVAERGSLAQAAHHLAERRGFAEDVASVERGLRRLRQRGSQDGGVWGQRVLRCFGLPGEVAGRIRWMGQYHTRFSDLPVSLGEELVRPWDRPPISESPARIWILLARAGLALRRREDPRPLLDQAGVFAATSELAARIELGLVEAYCRSSPKQPEPERARAALELAVELLATSPADALDPDDRACLHARAIDQRAYRLNKPHKTPPNKPGPRPAPDHLGALALYEQIPADGPPFARSRRENGLGWTRLMLGQREQAQAHAGASVEAAGDSGSLRMRAMALNLLAAASEGEAAERAKRRARDIAKRLEDEALLLRFGPRT